MANAIICMRPSSDISVGHTKSVDDGTVSAFMLINSAESDTSGYISCSRSSSDKTVTSRFGMTCNDDISFVDCIDKATLKVTHKHVAPSTISETFGLEYNGTVEYVPAIVVGGTLMDDSQTVSYEFPNAGAYISSYFAKNKKLPSINLRIDTSMNGYGDTKSASAYYYYWFCLELHVGIGVFRKVNSEWLEGKTAYKKANGSWVRITPDECLSIIRSHLISNSHTHDLIIIPSVDPTCTATGLTKGYKCSTCGDIIKAQEVVPAKGHSPTTVTGYSPTCGSTGLTNGTKCSVCGVTLTAQQVIPATGNHTYVSSGGYNVCTVCGHIEGMGYANISYYGTATPLTYGSYNNAATTVGNYALFAGGDDKSPIVDVYDKSLTKTSTTASEGREHHAATTVGNYALFGGGYYAQGKVSTIVDAFDTSLTRTSPTSLSNKRISAAATTVGNYALFGGGDDVSSVDAYSSSLTKSVPTDLSRARGDLAATTVGNYALFAGGTIGGCVNVDAYNTSLTRTIPTALSVDRYELSATTVSNYALFAGGVTNNTGVDVYNTSLTRTTPVSISKSWYSGKNPATTVANYAVFLIDSGSDSYVDIFNHSLTKISATTPSKVESDSSATTVGNYALFGGGYDTDTVNVYKISV